jgi:excisionase family DNA binding protein
MNYDRITCRDFCAIADYLGINHREWSGGWFRLEDGPCRHCPDRCSGFLRCPNCPNVMPFACDQPIVTDRHKLYSAISATFTCPCCELRDGVYHDNAAYYDARFLTIREAAARIGVSHTTLYAWRKSGKLNATNGLVGNRFIDAENCPLLNHRPAELAA